MAEPLSFTVRRDVGEELRSKIENAPTEHAEAVLAAYELLQEAQDHGVLDILRGAIGAGEVFVGKAAEYANTPEGIRAMRNLLAMVSLLGSIDPEALHRITKAITATQSNDKSQVAEPPSLWQIYRRLTSKNSRRTWAMAARFAETFGQEQNTR